MVFKGIYYMQPAVDIVLFCATVRVKCVHLVWNDLIRFFCLTHEPAGLGWVGNEEDRTKKGRTNNEEMSSAYP